MKAHRFVIGILMIVLSNFVYAGACGKGKVTLLEEGYYNTDNLAIKIDYSINKGVHVGTESGGYTLYKKDNISETRVNAIRAVALSALVSWRIVELYSHNNNCSNATQIRIF